VGRESWLTVHRGGSDFQLAIVLFRLKYTLKAYVPWLAFT